MFDNIKYNVDSNNDYFLTDFKSEVQLTHDDLCMR